MANFYCPKCQTGLYIDISATIKILCIPGIGKKSLKATIGTMLSVKEDKIFESIFYCPTCDINIIVEDVFYLCSSCFTPKSVKELYRKFVGRDFTSLIVCKECMDALEKEEDVKFVPFIEFITHIYL